METTLVSDLFIDYACHYLNYYLPCSCQPLVFHGQVITPIMSLVLFICVVFYLIRPMFALFYAVCSQKVCSTLVQ